MINIIDLARIFLSIESMSHKKLQKLCFYAQALFLSLTETRLANEDFQAWMHGPVSAKLYQQYKQYGYDSIPSCEIPNNIDDDLIEFVYTIYDTFGKMSANELEHRTHTESPWIIAREGLNSNEAGRSIISDQSMINFYRKYWED